MSDRFIGHLFVAGQVVVLLALALQPGRSDWPTPRWLRFAGLALIAGGALLMGVSALRLGSALTPSPVPKPEGQLVTTGLYRWMRHPIYTGVLVVVSGHTLRTGSWLALAAAVATLGFFHVKAGWEESRLAARYPDYAAYAARTPRFFPGPR